MTITLKIYSLFVALLWSNMSIAQMTKAKIQPVAKTGLYKMIVPAEIRSYSKDDLSDFRILDAQNNEVPYFLLTDAPEKRLEQFEEFAIVSKVVNSRKSTSIEIVNPHAQINDLKLIIANSEVIKKYSISGSNDQKEWFGLINNGILSDLQSSKTTSVSKEISFPLCSYRFLKIVLDDSTTLPINVLKIGNARTNFLKGEIQEIKVKSLQSTQLSAEKKTLIKIEFDYPQFIDKVVFDINKTSLFKRYGRIYTDKERIEKNKTVKYQEEIEHFSLVSNQSNAFEVDNTKLPFLYIEIDNQDNPPLQISNIQFYQKPIFAIAELKSKENYTIKTGFPNLITPSYDLAYFKETISDSLPETQIISIEHQEQNKATDNPMSFWQQPWFMWLCIIIAGLMLLFFSMRLVKEM